MFKSYRYHFLNVYGILIHIDSLLKYACKHEGHKKIVAVSPDFNTGCFLIKLN